MYETLLFEALLFVGFLIAAGYSIFFIRELDMDAFVSNVKLQILAGGVLGAIGFLLMNWYVGIEQVMIDLRHLPIVLSATFLHVPAVLVATLIISGGRFILGGMSDVALVGSIFTFFIGVSCAIFSYFRLNEKMKFIIMCLLSLFIIYIGLYIEMDILTATETTVETVFYPYAGVVLLTCFIIYFITHSIFDNQRLGFQLKNESARLTTLLENAYSGTLVESEDRKISLVNDQFYHIFQLDPATSLVGRMAKEIFYRDAKKVIENCESFYEHVDHLVQNKLPTYNEEIKFKDGRIIEYDFFPVEGNKLNGFMWNFRDITKRKRDALELQQSTNNYRRLFEKYESVVESVREVIFQTDMKGNWTFLNKSWERIMGFSVEKSLGEHFISYIHPADRMKVKQLFQPLVTGEVESLCHELRYLNRDGEQLWLEVYANVTNNCNGDKTGIMGTLFDITERKVMEEKIIESEQMYKSLFEHNQSLTYLINEKGTFVELNDASEQITGYKKSELVGKAFVGILREGRIMHTFGYFERALNGESMTFETEIVHKSGKLICLVVNFTPVLINSQIKGVIGIATDVTKQKEFERKLIDSENRYRTLTELSPEGIFVHTETQIEFINDKVLELLGLEQEADVVGKSILDFLHQDDLQLAAENLRLGFAKDKGFTNHTEVRFVKADGEVVDTEIGVKMIQYNGKMSMLGVIHDITLNKQVEKKLKEANEILRQISNVDGLTGIPNRRYYEERFMEEWQIAVENKQRISLIMFDIDKFKNYNDTFGHLQGDQCLKLVATTLNDYTVDLGYFMARYGGEEFSVILPNTSGKKALQVADALRKEIASLDIPHPDSCVARFVTISCGVACLEPKKGMDYVDLIQLADEALYTSKRKGRNQSTLI